MKLWRIALGAAVAAAAWALRDVPGAIGGRPVPAPDSPQFRGNRFHNRVSANTMPTDGGSVRDMLRRDPHRRPPAPVPSVVPVFDDAPGAYVTWFGHATSLVELDGHRVLFDPVWSARVSPSRLVGPRRLHQPPIPIEDLPRLDAIVISHDHYDHLDMATVRALTRAQTAPFVVPLGIGSHLRRWNVPAHRVIELDWDQSTTLDGLTLTATPARHFSGRLFARDRTLWASWVAAAGPHKVFYTGDSGYFDGYRTIGDHHGPFDASLIQIGAYAPSWPDVHMTPEEGITAHEDLRGGLLIPVHWATFTLAPHPWPEPANRVWSEAKARDIPLAIPRIGERVAVATPPPIDPWWQTS